MKMGPDFKKPPLEIEIPETYHDAANVDEREKTTDISDLNEWWRAFNDPEIDEIVKNVIKNNQDIRAAAARILEVQSVFKQTRADQFPNLGLNAEAGRQSYSTVNPLTNSSSKITSDYYGLSLPASFEIDFWGRLARATESSRAQLIAAEEGRRTIINTLVAEAVSLYLNIEAIERQIQVNHKSIDAFKQSLDVVENRYRRGLTTILDVRQASRMLAQAESYLPSLSASLGLKRQALAVLQGRYPESLSEREQPSDYFKLPPEIPAGLPSELIARRPDIKAAEASLHSACAQIGVAKAVRFPQIKLTGSFGYASSDLNTLFDPQGQLWNIAAGASQSVFDAGKLSAGQKAAEARYQQSLAAYAQTILSAFAEVEGALLNRQQQIERRKRLLKYRDESALTLDVANDRYSRGLVNYLTILDSQQVRVDAELQLISVEYEILANHVSLCRSLGGGWEQNPVEGENKPPEPET